MPARVRPVKGILRGQNFKPAFVVAETPRQFVKALVGLGPAVAKEDFSRPDPPRQFLRQPPLRLVIIEIGNMPEPPRLLHQGLRDLRVGVAQRANRDPAAQIQVTFAVDVPNPGAFAPFQHHVETGIGRKTFFRKSS